MMLRLGRRVTQAKSPPPPTGSLPCHDRGCGRSNAVPCAYKDRRRRACDTAWCPDHYAVVGGVPYCRRHAGVVRALAAQPPELRLNPDVGNRAASLCEWIGNDLAAGGPALLKVAHGGPSGRNLSQRRLPTRIEGPPR